MMRLKIIFISLLLFPWSALAAPIESYTVDFLDNWQNIVTFSSHLGAMYSTGLKSVLEDAYGDDYDIHGATTSFCFGFEGGLNLHPKISVTYSMQIQIGFISKKARPSDSEIQPLDDDDINLGFMNSINGKYFFENYKKGLFVSLGIGSSDITGSYTRVNIKDNGINVGLGTGYIFARVFYLELKYLYIPGKYTFEDEWVRESVKHKNFGGIQLTLARYFVL